VKLRPQTESIWLGLVLTVLAVARIQATENVLSTLSVFGVGQFGRVVSEGRVKYLARAHYQPSNRRLKQYRRGDVMESWGVDCGKGAISVDCKGLQKGERGDFVGVVTPS